MILGLALPLIVAPPKVQNQLTLTCEGTLKYYGFDRSSQSASVEGEGLEKYNPGKSVCKRDQTTSRSNHIQKQSTVYCFVRKLHELRLILSLRSRKHMPTFCSTKNLLYRPPLKEMGPSTGVADPAKTTARMNQFNQVSCCQRHEMKIYCPYENVSCLLFVAFDGKKWRFSRLSDSSSPLPFPDRSFFNRFKRSASIH